MYDRLLLRGENEGEKLLIAKTNPVGIYIPYKPSEHCSIVANNMHACMGDCSIIYI